MDSGPQSGSPATPPTRGRPHWGHGALGEHRLQFGRAVARRCPRAEIPPRVRAARCSDRARCPGDEASRNSADACAARQSAALGWSERYATCRCRARPRQHDGAITAFCLLPAAHEQVDFLVPADQRRRGRAHASNRLSAALAPSTCHAGTFSAKPLRQHFQDRGTRRGRRSACVCSRQ